MSYILVIYYYGVTNFSPSWVTLKYIYVRNPLSLDLSPLYLSIKGNLTLAALTPLILSLSIPVLSINRLTITYNYPIVTSYKLVSAILVSLPKAITTSIVSALTSAFSGILFNFFYYN